MKKLVLVGQTGQGGIAERRCPERGQDVWIGVDVSRGQPEITGKRSSGVKATHVAELLAPRSSQRGNACRVWQRSIHSETNHNLVTVRTRTRTNSRLVNRHETPSGTIEGTVPKASTLPDLTKTVIADVARILEEMSNGNSANSGRVEDRRGDCRIGE